mgnify:CR=1 FL=1
MKSVYDGWLVVPLGELERGLALVVRGVRICADFKQVVCGFGASVNGGLVKWGIAENIGNGRVCTVLDEEAQNVPMIVLCRDVERR